MTELTTVILKNGAEEVKLLAIVTIMSPHKLSEEEPIAFYELNEMCKDRTHKPFGNTGKILLDLNLISRGRMPEIYSEVHDSIRNVVLSAVDGSGLDMTLGSPIRQQPDQSETSP